MERESLDRTLADVMWTHCHMKKECKQFLTAMLYKCFWIVVFCTLQKHMVWKKRAEMNIQSEIVNDHLNKLCNNYVK